jgi:hypothetical protein
MFVDVSFLKINMLRYLVKYVFHILTASQNKLLKFV